MLQLFTSRNEGRVGKRAGTILSFGKTFLPSIAHGQIAPPEVTGPFILFSQRNWGDASILQLLDNVQEFTPGFGCFCDTSLLKEGLIVPHAYHAKAPRHTVDLTFVPIDRHRARQEGFTPTILGQGIGQILHQTSIRILPEHATTPSLEQIGRIAGLHIAGQFILVWIPGDHRNLDLNIGMSSDILIGQLLPIIGDIAL